ncbi:aldo/keto reductase [Vibrio mangrovi]|uniref:Aldo/keto reductase n=1 Tax=Vibrio mangrovi TaxID=474394 RepID=A0A1Y6IZV2_9VIBR|nr:aldo/keto reductase [Vibrio mangrovi]MDW6005248.1 aldo/keto reductase [Vibrio mangrovi]SMS02541.1 General stress protein 69 [Vibrio mangrovi]
MNDSLFGSPRIGLGCMNLSHAYGTSVSKQAGIDAIHAALEMGYRHLDTATLYGKGANEELLSQALQGKRDSVFLASKCGMYIDPASGKKRIDGRPESIKVQCEHSLRRLNTDYIDLYYLHRLDPDTPIEESVAALAGLVQEGKIGAIGLSEISAATLARAQAVHPIKAVQSEYSLWTRNPEIAVLEACRQSGITLVAFSPVARGFLANGIHDVTTLESTDIRNHMPRFQSPYFEQNLRLLSEYHQIAQQCHITPAQLALAWLLAQGEHIVPIPGTRSVEHMQENLDAKDIVLDPAILKQLDQLINYHTVYGSRYNSAQQQEIDTEEFI